MHLAVRSVDALESCRPVRALLVKGAKKDIRDKMDKIPQDYIRDVQSKVLAQELENLFQSNTSKIHMILGSTPV